MKKIFKFVSLSLAAIMLASCEAKSPLMSVEAFKKVFDEKIYVKKDTQLPGKKISYKRVTRNLETMSYMSEGFTVEADNYEKMITKPTVGASMSVTHSIVTDGVITLNEEDGSYSETGTSTDTPFTISLVKDTALDGNYFRIEKKVGKTETLVSQLDEAYDGKEIITDSMKNYINSFFSEETADEDPADLLNDLKDIYNGYLEEILASMTAAGNQIEIINGGTNYIYRYLSGEGYHEFQISNEYHSIDRVGYRTTLDAKQAVTIALSGF